jgi:hypothetical protein
VNAGHIHNRTAWLHGQERLLGEVHRPEEIDIENLLPVLWGQVLKGLEGHQAGVVHHDVDLTKAVHRGCHGGCNLRLRGDVARHPERIRRTDLAHALSARLGGVAFQVGNDNARALGPEALGGGEADAARRACDNGDLVAKAHRMILPPT